MRSQHPQGFEPSGRITRKRKLNPPQTREPPPAGYLNRRRPARHPAATRRAPWTKDSSFPSQLAYRFEYERCRQTHPCTWTERTIFGFRCTGCTWP